MTPSYTYNMELGRVYDGDSFKDCTIYLPFNLTWRNCDIRLYGLDCPEVRGIERGAGLAVRDLVRQMVKGKELVLKSHKDEKGKYVEILGEVWVDSLSINQYLLAHGLAKSYDGKEKSHFSPEECKIIKQKANRLFLFW